jgi:hypothetical protein
MVTEEAEYSYYVFISYSRADQEWVRSELLPRLKKTRISYIDQLNFELGRPKLDEIERAIRESRRSLLILTPSYLEDTWRQFDSILAGSYGLDVGEWRAIPAIKDKCDLPARLRALVRVDLSAADENEWQRLVRALSPQRVMDHRDRTRLRQLLMKHFNAEELRTLCFDLGEDYDDLPGEGKANKARELIGHLERCNRIPELVEICSELRPNVSWESRPEVAPGTLPEPGYSHPVSQGLNALTELMQVPKVRDVVVELCTRFEAACEQIDALDDYKHVHDLLHTLQFHCYNPIVQEATRFPDDDMALDNLMAYDVTLQAIVHDLKDAAERASFTTTETLWIQDLVRAQAVLGQAIEELNAKLLKTVIWHLNRVLSVQPSQINTRLKDAARSLGLPDLVKAMARVSDKLACLDLDPEKVNLFEAGVDALVSLNDSLPTLVEEHDKWQCVDIELRRIEGNMGQDMMELKMSWPYLKDMTEPLYSGSSDEWAASFRKDSNHLDSAIAAENPVRIKRYFQRYRRRAGSRFHQVDDDLKRLCEDLRRVGEPLALVMRVMQ